MCTHAFVCGVRVCACACVCVCVCVCVCRWVGGWMFWNTAYYTIYTNIKFWMCTRSRGFIMLVTKVWCTCSRPHIHNTQYNLQVWNQSKSDIAEEKNLQFKLSVTSFTLKPDGQQNWYKKVNLFSQAHCLSPMNSNFNAGQQQFLVS